MLVLNLKPTSFFMKNLLLILVFSTIFISTFQSQSIQGNYVRSWDPINSGVLILTLKLNEDSTFTYHYYQTFTPSLSEKNNYENNSFTIPSDSTHLNPEKNIYGKGTWKLDKTIVTFYTDKKNDFNEKFTLDFNNSKARFISKSPRDISDKVVKTALRFYESEVIGVKGTEYFKVE